MGGWQDIYLLYGCVGGWVTKTYLEHTCVIGSLHVLTRGGTWEADRARGGAPTTFTNVPTRVLVLFLFLFLALAGDAEDVVVEGHIEVWVGGLGGWVSSSSSSFLFSGWLDGDDVEVGGWVGAASFLLPTFLLHAGGIDANLEVRGGFLHV